jgi:hypothetical protein
MSGEYSARITERYCATEGGTMTGKQLCIATTHPAVVQYARLSGLRVRLTEDGLLKFNSRHSPRFASTAGLAFYCRQRLRLLQRAVVDDRGGQ